MKTEKLPPMADIKNIKTEPPGETIDGMSDIVAVRATLWGPFGFGEYFRAKPPPIHSRLSTAVHNLNWT